MIFMKAKPYREHEDGRKVPCEPSEATHVELNMPGPMPFRLLPVIRSGSRDKSDRKPVWSWNGETDSPTLKPSIKTTGGRAEKPIICHTWVNDGRVQFLSDCTHELAGTTVDLLDVK